MQLIYFPNTPTYIILSIFLLAALIANRMGLKAITNINLIIVPIGLISMLILFLSTSKNFVFERFFPILGYGLDSTFFSGLANMFAFGGIAFLYFINPILKDYKKFKNISIVSIAISSVYLLLSVASMLLVFSYSSGSDQTIAIYSLTRTIEYGRFLQRVDAIFILIWILLALSYISIIVALNLSIFKKITNISNSKAMVFSFITLLFGISFFINNVSDGKYIHEVLYKNFELILVFGISFAILLIANIKLKLKKGT